jgi:hypothetical protein
MADGTADIVPHQRTRLDRADHLVQHAETKFPGLHDGGEFRVDGHHGLDLRALVDIEGAERKFRGERDMVFAIGHQSRSNVQTPRFKS